MAVLGTGLVLVLAGLGVLFSRAGLDDADKLASVLGAFTGVAGLALSAYGVVLARRPQGTGAPAREADGSAPATHEHDPDARPPHDEEEGRRGAPGPQEPSVRNTISGTVHGSVVQGHTFTGPITLGPSPTPPPGRPEQPGSPDGR
ncbi:hypothetical protein Sme01_04520 [Sphaerisporangium melleum]|uniref:Uncharacterized protein n=1 Tax=Sphaerisporangium melleum TaxID=321316 RepID=A0A917VCG8_9ACTN|nr:hypothetical protein GCM10007964_02070 [Sphaerisporangium melleum]GII67976.1 hypothetical protein Sme01_04520 [Sphaerisporangium melleum]